MRLSKVADDLRPRFALPTLVGLLALIVVTLPIQRSAHAAEAEKASWYQVISFKFKANRADEARKLIHDHFQKVDKAIGRRIIAFDYQTGEWDHVVYFPLDITRMEPIPSNAEFFKAFANQEGGTEQAQKLFQSFLDMVTTSRTEIAQLSAASSP